MKWLIALLAALLASSLLSTQPVGEFQLPRFSTPPTCGAARAGGGYFDTDDNFMYYCNGTAWVRWGTPVRWIDFPSAHPAMVASDNTGTLSEAALDVNIITSSGFTDASNWSSVFIGGSGFMGTTSAGTGPAPKPVDIFCDTQWTGGAHCISFWIGGSRQAYFDRTTNYLNWVSDGGVIGVAVVDWTNTVQASLGTASNGMIKYCSNCNPDATCTSGGAGTFAFAVNGAWTCELN